MGVGGGNECLSDYPGLSGDRGLGSANLEWSCFRGRGWKSRVREDHASRLWMRTGGRGIGRAGTRWVLLDWEKFDGEEKR